MWSRDLEVLPGMEVPTANKQSSRGLNILPNININMNIRRAMGIGSTTPNNGSGNTILLDDTTALVASPITPSTPPVAARKSMHDHNRDSRLSMDSISSTAYGDDDDDDKSYVWNQEQVNIIVRVCLSSFCRVLEFFSPFPLLDCQDIQLTHALSS